MRRPRIDPVFALLFTVAGFVQSYTCQHATVPALDAVRHIALAQSIEQRGLASMIGENADHPLFPTCVAALHSLLPATLVQRPTAWLATAQLVAATAAVLCLVPLYALLHQWLGRNRARIGCAVFVCLPVVARLGAEGIADSCALLALLTALLCLVVPLSALRAEHCQPDELRGRPRTALWLALSGTATAVSLLCGIGAIALIPALALFALLARPIAPALPVRLVWCTPYMLGLTVTFGAYLVSVGANSPQQMLSRLLGSHRADAAALLNSDGTLVLSQIAWLEQHGTPLEFTRKDTGITTRRPGWTAAVQSFAAQLGHLSHYWLGLVAAYGAWKMRRARNCLPGRLLFMFAVTFTGIAIVHASSTGYLSPRHLLPLAPVIVGWAAQGIWSSASGIARIMRSWRAAVIPRPVFGASAATLTLLAPVVVVLMLPLHPHRLSHQLAGRWLSDHTRDGEVVFDTVGLTALYSGRTTFRAEAGGDALACSDLAYVVVDAAELQSRTRRAATLRRIVDDSAELVGAFGNSTHPASETVLLYRWRPERFAARYTKLPQQQRNRRS